MLFNSLHFLIFFPIVSIIYFCIPYRFRWVWLLISSCYFYMSWRVGYLFIILFSSSIDYFAAQAMERFPDRKKKYLVLSLSSNLAILFAFKYFDFFNDSVQALSHALNIPYAVPALHLILPLGISFHTFQSMSYAIDVYRGQKKAEHHYGIFLLYVAFFPQLVAGPIERSVRLIRQFYVKHDFDYERITDGLKLMCWGFFQKVVIADRLALYVNTIYNNPTDYNGMPLIIATYFFAFQIYCDFSGYTNIAIGSAKIFGIDLMENFRRPYFATSVADFWHRWHISLSTWFRDYLYVPLGGNKKGRWRWYYNIFIVFFLSGLWHGARWTFVIWGVLHAFYYLFAIWTKAAREKMAQKIGFNRFPNILRLWKMFATFHLVVFGWIFFRANSLEDAIYIFTHMFANFQFKLRGAQTGLPREDAVMVAISLAVLIFVEIAQSRTSLRGWIKSQPALSRWSIYYAALLSLFLFGIFREQQFIYFQF